MSDEDAFWYAQLSGYANMLERRLARHQEELTKAQLRQHTASKLIRDYVAKHPRVVILPAELDAITDIVCGKTVVPTKGFVLVRKLQWRVQMLGLS